MRETEGGRTVWRLHGPWWRTFAKIWLPVTLLFLGATFVVADIHWGTRAGALCNVVAGVSFWAMARMGTAVDAQGITVTPFLSRHLSWTEVVELRTDPPGRFAADVQAVLADGSTVTLPAVPAQDVPHLESLRSGY